MSDSSNLLASASLLLSSSSEDLSSKLGQAIIRDLLTKLSSIPSSSLPSSSSTNTRRAVVERKTNETQIYVEVDIDGKGEFETRISTGVGFLDHMFHALAKHGHLDLILTCKGDLHIDDHHTSEDCAIAFGSMSYFNTMSFIAKF